MVQWKFLVVMSFQGHRTHDILIVDFTLLQQSTNTNSKSKSESKLSYFYIHIEIAYHT